LSKETFEKKGITMGCMTTTRTKPKQNVAAPNKVLTGKYEVPQSLRPVLLWQRSASDVPLQYGVQNHETAVLFSLKEITCHLNNGNLPTFSIIPRSS
jgi:hypothetical protein